jgi:hypothetical protein
MLGREVMEETFHDVLALHEDGSPWAHGSLSAKGSA